MRQEQSSRGNIPPNPYPNGPPEGTPVLPKEALLHPTQDNRQSSQSPTSSIVLHEGELELSQTHGKRYIGGTSRYRDTIVNVWQQAPFTSHISRFAFTDARTSDILRGEESQLQVVFRGKHNIGEVAEYVYYFINHDLGARIFLKMTRAAHPYGEVLLPDVIDEGIPYSPLHLG